MAVVYCTVFVSTIYCKNVPETTVASPPGRILQSNLTAHRLLGAACALSLQALAQRPKDGTLCCPPPGQAPASPRLPSPPSLAGKGSADAKGSGHSLAYSLWLWSPGPMPGSLLPRSQVTHRHLPEEMLGGQGWPQSFRLPQVLRHGQTGVTAASVVEKARPF